MVYDGHLTQPTIEGTKMYKRDGRYYIFSPAGGVSTGWQTVLRSDNPFGPYEERIVMAWAKGTINGPHQGAWVEGPDGGDWFIHFQDKGPYGRIVHLQPMRWLPDGWPLIGEDPDGDGVGQPVSSWKSPTGARQEKEGRVLSGPYGIPLDWQYPAVPSPYWHHALPDGGIRLYSVESPSEGSLWNCPNILSRKFPAENFTVEARITFHPSPVLSGEEAGFVVTGNDYGAIRIADNGENASLFFVLCEGASKGEKERTTQIASIDYKVQTPVYPYASGNVPAVKYPPLRDATLWVRLSVRCRAVEGDSPQALCRLYYSTNGRKYLPAGEEFKASPELWIGAKYGFYCKRTYSRNDSGWLDVEDVQVNY